VSGAAHPGRSLDFLSRLHDGELSAAERAHFESHRSHCAECRRAAAEFEAALAFYRTAGTAPPSSDLAARILRKLEASNPRRPPFGVVFGIDLKWAGAFTAAIVAVILGFSLFERQEQDRRIRVSFATPSAGTLSGPVRSTTALPGRAEPEARANAAPEGRRAPASPPTSAAERPDAKLAARPAAAVAPAAGPAPTAVPRKAQASVAKEESLRGLAQARDQAAAPVPEQAKPSPSPVRITVTALDREGTAPALLNAADLSLGDADRGQYVLTVGADGVPLEVGASGAERKKVGVSASGSGPASLRKMRFEPGDRPRRLLVRVE
jgi:hypothetical protein